ncbi:MAG: hypothetical protein BGN88_13860 [Clostridiales bacterium 43-6]|nr:MAG: hypothetical protein BGN88_13860 [Clostridiales bacterium 43-6]
MKFSTIAIKNFKVNLKKYLSYFLCSSFSIMLFFMYATLLFNKSLKDGGEKEVINIIFFMSLTVIALFSVFFINYAHTAFVKSRYKEFGIYMTLGMTSKDIRKIILIENSFIIASSFVTGLVSGVIFSRLFQMVVASILDLQGIEYSLSLFSFALTVGVFAIVFLLVLTLSRLHTRKLEIGELLSAARKNEKEIKAKLLPGILGFVILVVSLAAFVIVSDNDTLNTNPVFVIINILLIFTGVYLTIANAGMAVLAMIKGNKKSYYQNVLLVTEITSKFNQNKKIIFVLSILSSMIVFFVASPFSLFSLAEKISGMNQPNHIEYASVYGVNNLSDAKLAEILKSSPTPLEKQNRIEFLALGFHNDAGVTDKMNAKPVINVSAYNQYTNSSITVTNGQVYNAIISWEPGNFGIAPGSMLTVGGKKLTVTESKRAPWVSSSSSFLCNSGLVVSDEDYQALRSANQNSVGVFHTFMFKDWKNTQKTIDELTAAVKAENAKITPAVANGDKLITVISRILAYTELKKAYSLFIFVTAVMGLLFFIAAGSVLFFKQYTETESARQKYDKLYKIGLVKKEAKGIITKELLVTFFSPLIFGSVMGYSFIYYMTHLVGGQDVMKEFMIFATVVVAAYFLFQSVFFFLTRKKYMDEVLKKY